ncbi:hypothetical protein PCNPT3_08305 [Psychromonas sp. CNPT3]|uniref:hypothetical protein n=1 Tax=Psychromonas sp. CNPT3 TaxID=314282 RepID=UPI00006EA488|nr:hypothetical protein [Psychromonas sp. CNPT3]AGH81599.1 hypothetical protein PCNPT3_08305 [Psychromonas sp. CNPT3]
MSISHLMHSHQTPAIIILPTEKFLPIPDNPVQRDTVARALKANKGKGHLRHPHPAHTVVSIALLIDETIDTLALTAEEVLNMVLDDMFEKMKLDGHTRSYLWDNDMLDAPPNLICSVYFVDDIEQAKDFYRAYDSNKAVETGKDKLFSSLRDAFGYAPTSKLWKKTGVKVAIEVAFNNNNSMPDEKLYNFHKTDQYACHTLKTIDKSTKLNLKAFTASVMAAMFLTVLRDGAQALEFWEKYSNAEGEFSKGKMDAIMMATTYFDEVATMGRADFTGTRPNYILTGHGRDVHPIYTPMYLSYYEAWKSGKTFTAKKKGLGYFRSRTSLTLERFLRNNTYKEFIILFNKP